MSHRARVRRSLSFRRFRGGADGGDGLLAAHVQRGRQSSLLSEQNQPGLLHHIPEVRQNSCEPKNIEKHGTQRCPETLSLCGSRMDRPSKITFLDSDGTAVFEYRVPKGQSHMVRHRFPPFVLF